MSLQAILTVAFAGAGVVVALATAIKAYLEYLQQGVQRRAQMFIDLRNRLQDPELVRLAELIDNALCADPQIAQEAEEVLVPMPLAVKRRYLGLFEEVALIMKWRLIEPRVANYMFGYYARNCRDCTAFWFSVNRGSPYWTMFFEFCAQMDHEDADLRSRVEPKSSLSQRLQRIMPTRLLTKRAGANDVR